MKIDFPKILLYIAFVVMMAASFIGGQQEKTILLEKNTVAIEAKKIPLEIKGVIYFVTDDQIFTYKFSRDVFIFGWVILIALMVWLRKRK